MEVAPAGATRVLLVEDEATDALAVRRSLRQSGASRECFELDHAATLGQGLEHLSRGAVDVLLLDLCLPDSEGPATVKRLREQDRRVPLVVFTGDDDPRVVADAFQAGADEFVVKRDLDGSLLRRAIRHAIQRRLAGRPGDRRSAASGYRTDGRGALHDLKNLHTTILGNARILQREVRVEGFVAQRLDALLGATRTAAGLVQRIADAEEALEATGLLEVSAFVRRAEPLLRADLPDGIDLRLECNPERVSVLACEDALRSVLLELVMNAVDAIGCRRGQIAVRTGCAQVAEGEVREMIAPGWIEPGPHAWIEVRDDGRGFDGDIRPRLFEPGFSTKGAGRGHGLGHVREILARHGAGLLVRSQPGSGSAFRVFLPARA